MLELCDEPDYQQSVAGSINQRGQLSTLLQLTPSPLYPQLGLGIPRAVGHSDVVCAADAAEPPRGREGAWLGASSPYIRIFCLPASTSLGTSGLASLALTAPSPVMMEAGARSRRVSKTSTSWVVIFDGIKCSRNVNHVDTEDVLCVALRNYISRIEQHCNELVGRVRRDMSLVSPYTKMVFDGSISHLPLRLFGDLMPVR